MAAGQGCHTRDDTSVASSGIVVPVLTFKVRDEVRQGHPVDARHEGCDAPVDMLAFECEDTGHTPVQMDMGDVRKQPDTSVDF